MKNRKSNASPPTRPPGYFSDAYKPDAERDALERSMSKVKQRPERERVKRKHPSSWEPVMREVWVAQERSKGTEPNPVLAERKRHRR